MGEMDSLFVFSAAKSAYLSGTMPPSIGNGMTFTTTTRYDEAIRFWLNPTRSAFILAYSIISGTLPPSVGQMSSVREFTNPAVRFSFLPKYISGTLPSVLQWTYLEKLHMGGATISGSLPDGIGSMTDGYGIEVWLPDTMLTGEIPARDRKSVV
jgi:hypothetical protein